MIQNGSVYCGRLSETHEKMSNTAVPAQTDILLIKTWSRRRPEKQDICILETENKEKELCRA